MRLLLVAIPLFGMQSLAISLCGDGFYVGRPIAVLVFPKISPIKCGQLENLLLHKQSFSPLFQSQKIIFETCECRPTLEQRNLEASPVSYQAWRSVEASSSPSAPREPSFLWAPLSSIRTNWQTPDSFPPSVPVYIEPSSPVDVYPSSGNIEPSRPVFVYPSPGSIEPSRPDIDYPSSGNSETPRPVIPSPKQFPLKSIILIAICMFICCAIVFCMIKRKTITQSILSRFKPMNSFSKDPKVPNNKEIQELDVEPGLNEGQVLDDERRYMIDMIFPLPVRPEVRNISFLILKLVMYDILFS
jgi:hypothetical protein